jgi:hypothetical protein
MCGLPFVVRATFFISSLVSAKNSCNSQTSRFLPHRHVGPRSSWTSGLPRGPVCPSDAGVVFGIEIGSHSSDLAKLELCEAQATPALRRAHWSAEHQFEHGLLS